MIKKHHFLLIGILALALAGCGQLPFLGGDQTPEVTATQAATPQASPTPSVGTTQALTLEIWLPPEFDPAGESPAGALLQARLDEFSQYHPGVRVNVRIKALEGDAGLLNSLIAAYEAAPLALPDLVALPRSDLQSAASRGILTPLDDLLNNPDDEDWYDYARQMSRVNENTYGLPFAGDALVMAYHPGVLEAPPADWENALAIGAPLAFPAADTRALFTLLQYQAIEPSVLDENGEGSLDAVTLTPVLEFLEQGSASGLFPFWLTQYDSDEQAWQAFLDGRASMAATWASRLLSDPPADSSAAPLPTQGGNAFTLATGWSWAVSSPASERHALTVELAEYLSESAFLAEWISTTGYLPTRPSELAAWPVSAQQALVSQIVPSAQLMPRRTVLTILGSALQQATIAVLKDEADAASAAQTAVESLSN